MAICDFQTLYSRSDGYVVRCKHCGHYQVAFLCIMVTLTVDDFPAFGRMVKQRSLETNEACSEHSKCVVIETPAAGVCFILTRSETKQFSEMLDQADNEEKAVSLLSLFNQ